MVLGLRLSKILGKMTSWIGDVAPQDVVLELDAGVVDVEVHPSWVAGASVDISLFEATPTVFMNCMNAYRMSLSDAPLFWRSMTRLKASCLVLVVTSEDSVVGEPLG